MESELWEPAPSLFLAGSFLLVLLIEWPRRWLFAGAPMLTWLIMLEARQGRRIFPSVNLWALLATLNLLYAISATSWLLYWIFAACCYPTVFILCLDQFQFCAIVVRRTLRFLLRTSHFTSGKVAYFGLPSLTIDTDVDGMMVVRGVTVDFPTLTIEVHGVEVGISLEDGLELGILTETVTIALLRSIRIGDVYVNLKDKSHKSRFGYLDENARDANNTTGPSQSDADRSNQPREERVPLDEMANRAPPDNLSPKEGMDAVTPMAPGEEIAGRKYSQVLEEIDLTSAITQSQKLVTQRVLQDEENKNIDVDQKQEMHAAICSQLHSGVSVPHPAPVTIKVTTLQTLLPPRIRRFLHRLPMLLRLLLNVLSSSHTIDMASITATVSGELIQQQADEKLFKQYGETISEIRNLQEKVSSWLYEANFVISMAKITASAHVPFLSSFNIINQLKFGVTKVYRSLPKETDLAEVLQLGGAEVTVSVPAHLLPHHEHLLPLKPAAKNELADERAMSPLNGSTDNLQAEQDVEQKDNDMTNIIVSGRALLPATFDQQLLSFMTSLIRAAKIIEIEKEPDAFDEDIHGIKGYSNAVRDSIKDSVKRRSVSIGASDAWIATIFGKAVRFLESAPGEIGYSQNIPIPLEPYRNSAETASKLLA